MHIFIAQRVLSCIKLSMIKNILFDLDGTLTDPSEGIINCIVYALEKLGADIPDNGTMRRYIGPPLWESFAEMLKTNEKSEAQRAVEIYRERFSVIGMYENLPYVGVQEMLKSITDGGYTMYVCTSKPKIFAEKILEHFSLHKGFKKVYGSSLDGTHVEKDTLIAHLLKEEKLNPAESVMIGDRIYDISGAIANRVTPYGVTYGFGNSDELKDAEKTFNSAKEIEIHFKR